MTYYVFHARDLQTQTKMADGGDVISLREFFVTFKLSIDIETRTASGGGSFASGQRCPSHFKAKV